MNADGSGVTRLTDNDAVDFSPAWSPDGQRIAFHSDRDENWDIYVTNPDGSDIARLTDNDAEDGSPAWSPGGQRIAFSSYFGRNSRIHVKDVGTDIPEPAATTTASPSQERSGSQTESDTARETFEASSPSGYTRVSLTDQGTVWGIPERFTTDSSLAVVTFMLLGSVRGCSFANGEVDRSSIVYIKLEQLGRLSDYESKGVCRTTSNTWSQGWDGQRITHLRFFDGSVLTGFREYVYDSASEKYVESSANSG